MVIHVPGYVLWVTPLLIIMLHAFGWLNKEGTVQLLAIILGLATMTNYMATQYAFNSHDATKPMGRLVLCAIALMIVGFWYIKP